MILKNKIFISALLLGCTIIACKKNELRLLQFDLPTDKAYVRLALYSPNTPSVMIKINDVKINGGTTGGNGGFFPAVSTTPDYSAITPNGTLRLSLPNVGTANDSVLIFSGPISVEAGKFYSVTLADTGVDRTVFSIRDNLGVLPDSGFFNLRLINAMPKTDPINLIRVDSSSSAVVRDTIARNIAFKSATDFIKTSISPLAGYSFLKFRTVTTTGITLASATPPSASTLSKRSVTIYAFGYANGIIPYAPGISLFVYNQ